MINCRREEETFSYRQLLWRSKKTWRPDPNTGNSAVAGAVVYAFVGVLGIVLLVSRWYFEGYAHQFEVQWKAVGVLDGRGIGIRQPRG